MKTIITAMALMFMISANAAIVSAHEDENDGYKQHESEDHGDKDRHEHGDRDRSEYHAADREGNNGTDRTGSTHYGSTAHRAGGSEGSTADAVGDFLHSLWPF